MRHLALALLIFTNFAWAADFQPPAYSRPVMDEAHLLSADTAEKLSVQLEQIYRAGGSQIAVLTVDSLNGIPIESAGIKTAEVWKLGTAKGDNGVLLLISKGDRAMRIEVGQGLEGALTDIYSKRIIEDVIVPRFKAGEFEGGVLDGVVSILGYTDPNVSLTNLASRRERSRGSQLGRNVGLIGILAWLLFNHPIIFVFLLFFVLSMFGRGRHRGFWGGGGGFGGGGGGFGGFSGGGGGGFSGGGSSGRW